MRIGLTGAVDDGSHVQRDLWANLDHHRSGFAALEKVGEDVMSQDSHAWAAAAVRRMLENVERTIRCEYLLLAYQRLQQHRAER